MTASAVALRLREIQVVLRPFPDGTFHYLAPHGQLTPVLLGAMRQHKQALHALVEAWSERAAILEYDAGLPRDAAEALAWQWMLRMPKELLPPTDKTDKTSFFSKKSLNGLGGSTDKTDNPPWERAQTVDIPLSPLSGLEPGPLRQPPCLHQWQHAGRQATCTACAFTAPVLPSDELLTPKGPSHDV